MWKTYKKATHLEILASITVCTTHLLAQQAHSAIAWTWWREAYLPHLSSDAFSPWASPHPWFRHNGRGQVPSWLLELGLRRGVDHSLLLRSSPLGPASLVLDYQLPSQYSDSIPGYTACPSVCCGTPHRSDIQSFLLTSYLEIHFPCYDILFILCFL